MTAVASRTDRVALERIDGVFPRPGQYMPTFVLDTPAGAVVCCPGCGEHVTLEDHEIAPTGEVNPSLECPSDVCDFHAYVRLERWPG